MAAAETGGPPAGPVPPANQSAPSLRAPLSVWRIAKAQFSAFDGEGARLYGGRWSPPGVRVVYTSATLSLAALEVLVHVDTDLAPDDLVAVRAQIPAGTRLETVPQERLPSDWRSHPAPDALWNIGREWLERAESAVLSVPSAIVPEERNYLLNPKHAAFSNIEIAPPRPFALDPRFQG